MKRRCKTCKSSFTLPARGRRPIYCSAACRQKAYRKRIADPYRRSLELLKSDFDKNHDRAARKSAAIKELVALGYEVDVRRRTTLPRPERKPAISVAVDNTQDPSS